jgi:hypothetical protein
MEASMITPHEVLLAVGLAAAGSGWFLHMAWNGFQNWLDDRAEARTPEGRARLAAERAHDEAWDASQADAMDTLTALEGQSGIPAVPAESGPLRRSEGRTQALTQLARHGGAEHWNEPHGGPDALRPLPEPPYAGSDDRFTDGTGPQDAVAAEISGVGAMLAVPKDRRENLGPDTADMRAIDDERSKWGFVPVRMGTPPHGMPVVDEDGWQRETIRRARGAYRPAALEALDWDSRRITALLAKADRVTGPKADWDLLARQCSRELVHA